MGRFLFGLSLAQLISWGSTFYLFGLLVQPIEAELHLSRAQSSLGFSLMLLAEGALAYPVGRWIDRGYARLVMSIGSACAALCLLALAQVTSLWGFYAAWGALGLALACILYAPVFAVVTRRYPQDFRRAIITITFLGGLASTVFIPLITWLIDSMGWRDAVMVLSFLHLGICLPVHGVLLRGEPQPPQPPQHPVHAAPWPAAPEPVHTPASLQACLRSPVFLLIGVFTALGMAVTAAIPAHLVPLLREQGLPPTWVVLVPTSIGALQVLGRVLLYRLEGRFNVHHVNLGIVLLMPAALLLLAVLMLLGPVAASAPVSIPTLVLGLAFATLFGLANGMMTIVKGTAIAQYVNRQHVAALNGALGLPAAVARALAPAAVGSLWGVSQGYGWGVALLLLLSVMGGGAFAVAQRLAQPPA